MGIARPTAAVAMLAMCVAASVTMTAAATEAPAGAAIAALTGFNSARNHQETSGEHLPATQLKHCWLRTYAGDIQV